MKCCLPLSLAVAGCVWLAADSGVIAETKARLTWNNGESLSGELLRATDSELIWNSPIFENPVPLKFTSLRSVTGDGKGTLPDESMAFNLRDGSRVYGDLVAIDEESLSLKSKRHGAIRLKRSEVISVHRLKAGRILWCGPYGEVGWAYGNATVPPGQRLQSAGGGAIRSSAWRQRISQPLKLPEKVEIEFRLSSSVRPEFEIKALVEGQSVTLTTWQDEMVIRHGARFISLGILKPEDRDVDLRIFWDREAGSGAVARANGELLGKWEAVPGEGDPVDSGTKDPVGAGANRIAAAMFPLLAPARRVAPSRSNSKPPVDGVSVTNRGPDIELEFLRVRSWNGDLPKETTSSPFRTRLELADESAIEGRVIRGTADSLIFQEEGRKGNARTVPLEQVESLYFPIETVEKEPANFELDEFRFADGTSLRGLILEIENGSATIVSRISKDPVAAALSEIREMNFHSPTPQGGEKNEPLPLSKQDKIVTGETMIHGAWHPSEGSRIQWRLAGAAEPVEMASSAKLEITRVPPESGNWARSPALFHLSGGQVAPGELVAIDGDGDNVEIRSEITEARKLSASQLQAIQFRGPEIDPKGFEDPGWQVVRGGKKAVQLKDGMVTMEPGGSWGHPSILVGDEIQFTLNAVGYGTIRVRMFCDGTDAAEPCSNFLLAHYGNEIYCGLEETPGQLNQRRDISVPQNKPVKIRFNWDNEATKIYINGALAVRTPVGEKAKRSGLGLLLEPAELWGNGERQIKVSDFSLRTAPGVTWVPGVNSKAKEKALFLPRFRKDDPPHHMLLAPNGDLLRGTIVAATGDRFAFRSGLEELSIPRDRVAAAIWLKPPEEKADAEVQEKPKTPEKKVEGPEPTHWLQLTSGARLGLAVESFGPEFVTGQSALLGECRIPGDHVHSIHSAKPESVVGALAFSKWQLKQAPEPVPDSGGDDSPMLGKPAPEIDLAILDGGRLKLSEEKDKIIVLDFWATWCGPCVRALPDMIQEFSKFDRERVRFIGVNQAEAPDQIKKFLDQRGWASFEVALDTETDAGRAYGVEGIPHTVIVDHEGKVAWVSTGLKPDGAKEAADIVRGLIEKAPDDRTLKILNAEDIRDLGIQPARFDEYMASFLADLISTDRGRAVQVFEKAVEIVETSRERDIWKLKPGDMSKTFVCDTVIQLRNQSDPVSWIAFQADLLRSQKVPPYELLMMWGERRVIDGFVGAEEGSLEPKLPIETSLKLLAEAAGNRELYPLVVSLLYKSLQRYDLDTVSLLRNAFESADGEALTPFLKEVEVALDVHFRMREGYRGRAYSRNAADHYIATLKDSAVPLPARVALAAFLVGDATPYPSSEMVLACADTVAEAWKGDTPVFQFWLFGTLEAFMREERDEAWKAVAVRLGEGFRNRYLTETPPAGIPTVPDDDLVCLMMDVYLSTGDVELAKTAFVRYQKRFVDFELPIIQFIRAGEFAAASELLIGQSLKIGRKENSTIVFDDRLEENAAAFLETIERPDLRLLVETMIANTRDPLAPGVKQPIAIKPDSPRSQRLQAAAKQFAETDFRSSRLRRLVFGWLGQDVAAGKLVADALVEEADEIDVDAAIESKTFSVVARDMIETSPDLRLVEGALLLQMATGEIEKAGLLLDWVAGAEPETSERKTEFAERILNLPARAILGSTDPEKTAEALIPLCQRLALGIEGLEAAETHVDKKRLPWAQLTLALVEAGKMNEFVPWVRSQYDDKAAEEKFVLWRTSAGDYFRFVAEKYRDAPIGERVAFLNELLAQDWVIQGFNPFTNGGFRNSGSSTYITPEELLEQGESMAKASPREGHAWNDLAFVFNGADRIEEALRCWDTAIAQRQAAGVEKEANRYRTNKARALFHLGRTGEAGEILKSINPDEFKEKEFAALNRNLVSGESLIPPISDLASMTREVRPSKPEAATKPVEEDEPDPFATMPAKEEAKPKIEVKPGDPSDEPDPFAAPRD